MRKLFVLGLAALMLAVALPLPAAAEDVKTFENKALGISFDYPATWTTAPAEPRGLLPNEVFNVRASGDPTSAFAVAVYQLGAVVTEDNLDSMLASLDQQAGGWIGRLPGGRLIESSDVTVDDADGREYIYEYQQNGQVIHADTIVSLNGDKAVEVGQWALQADYDAKVKTFDDIFASLILPWTPR
jgi:hypothetical protein